MMWADRSHVVSVVIVLSNVWHLRTPAFCPFLRCSQHAYSVSTNIYTHKHRHTLILQACMVWAWQIFVLVTNASIFILLQLYILSWCISWGWDNILSLNLLLQLKSTSWNIIGAILKIRLNKQWCSITQQDNTHSRVRFYCINKMSCVRLSLN